MIHDRPKEGGNEVGQVHCYSHCQRFRKGTDTSVTLVRVVMRGNRFHEKARQKSIQPEDTCFQPLLGFVLILLSSSGRHLTWWRLLLTPRTNLRTVVLGRTLLRVLVFGTLFWPHFGVPRQWFYPRERGCCRDQGWRCHFGSRFSWSFGCCISCCLGVFSGAILVAIPCLDRGWILAWSFGCLFCCCFGWPFRCCLGRCFALCFCVVGCLAPGLDPCVVVLVPVS